MTTTPVLGLTELASAQAIPEAVVNENTRWLEFFAAGGRILDRDENDPPGSPADGDAYLVHATATGAWLGEEGHVALRISTSWRFKPAAAGMILYVDDEDIVIRYDGAAWAELGGTAGLAASTTEQLTGTSGSKFATPDSVAALWEQGADVASAGTISLGEGGHFKITGTTTITDIDFATDHAGRAASVYFTGALTLTHNASTLILPGGANITTAAGDVAVFKSEGSDVVRCISYTRASGAALVASASAPSVQSVASSATVTPTFSDDLVKITAQAAGLTLANWSGTAVPGWGMAIRIKDNGTARAISYGSKYRAIGVTLPTTTVISKTLYLGCIYNQDDDKFDVVAVAQEA